MDQINEYEVFQDHGKAQIDPKSRKVSNAPDGYQKIRVYLIFAVKHDGRHKARLVAGGHLTPDPIESIYSRVVSIRSLRLVIFLAKLNNLEVWGADCWKPSSPFSNVHFRNTTKIAAQVLCSYLLLPLLLSLFSNSELFMYFCFCSFSHLYGSFNRDTFNIFELP